MPDDNTVKMIDTQSVRPQQTVSSNLNRMTKKDTTEKNFNTAIDKENMDSNTGNQAGSKRFKLDQGAEKAEDKVQSKKNTAEEDDELDIGEMMDEDDLAEFMV